jgi:hypothetical protein
VLKDFLRSTIEELLGRKSSGSGLESRESLALTSPTSGGGSVGIVRLRTQATEFSLVFFLVLCVFFNYSVCIHAHHSAHECMSMCMHECMYEYIKNYHTPEQHTTFNQ